MAQWSVAGSSITYHKHTKAAKWSKLYPACYSGTASLSCVNWYCKSLEIFLQKVVIRIIQHENEANVEMWVCKICRKHLKTSQDHSPQGIKAKVYLNIRGMGISNTTKCEVSRAYHVAPIYSKQLPSPTLLQEASHWPVPDGLLHAYVCGSWSRNRPLTMPMCRAVKAKV